MLKNISIMPEDKLVKANRIFIEFIFTPGCFTPLVVKDNIIKLKVEVKNVKPQCIVQNEILFVGQISRLRST
jgi:hypothetical protein